MVLANEPQIPFLKRITQHGAHATSETQPAHYTKDNLKQQHKTTLITFTAVTAIAVLLAFEKGCITVETV